MCWSFVIKPGCTANKSWLWWEDAFLSRKEGHKHLELKAWNFVTKHEMSRIEGWKGFTTVFRTRWSRCPLLATAWTPDLQDLGPGCVCEDVTGTLELDMFTLETIDLAFRRETTNQAMPLALLLGIWRPEFLPDLSANSGDTASQVNYDSKRLGKKRVFESLPTHTTTCDEAFNRKEEFREQAIPEWAFTYRFGTWIFVHGDFCHLTTEEDTIPVDHCDPRDIQPSWCGLHLHSCPSLPRLSTILYVKSNSSSQIAGTVSSQQRLSLFHECVFCFFS